MPTPNAFPAALTSSPFASWEADHTGVRVPDLETALDWYAKSLDFRLMQSTTHGELTFAYLAPAVEDSFRLELLAGPGATDRSAYKDLQDSLRMFGWHHTCFRAEAIDESVAELKRRGVTIVNEAFDVPPLGIRIAFFADPWGNIFELKQSIPH